MDSLIIPETSKTPSVRFDYTRGHLEVTGYRSMPETTDSFYLPLLNWIDQYIQSPSSNRTIFSIKLEYFNTSTQKCLVEIIKRLDQLASQGHKVLIQWYYEEDDEDMYASASDMEALVRYIEIEKISYRVS